MEPFVLTMPQPDKTYYLTISLESSNDRSEVYRVASVRKPHQYILVENNRPFIRVQKKLKTRRIDWKVIEGRHWNVAALAKLYAAIEAKIEQ